VSAAGACVATTPLERWIAGWIGAPEQSLTRAAIQQHQLKALQETLAWAREHSEFYRRRMSALCDGIPNSLEDFARIPLTSAANLAENMPGFLCVPQDEISRVVTLQSSGTSGAPKRIFFTAADQELALDFFANGVAGVAAAGERMLIALPGEREGSVGYQLAKGVARAGVIPIAHGLSVDPEATLAHMEREGATCVIGLPVQMLALAMHESAVGNRVMRRLHSIVLCSDHVAESLVRTLRLRSGAEIFEHYGMTEMGLGGGVDCEAHMGYHLREADLYFEIIDAETGRTLPDGETGEVVFTTLNRRGMPLIRYRTGDVSRFVPGPCGCGTALKRLERVRGRVDGDIRVGAGGRLNIAMLDEVLFAIPGLLDFTATLFEGVRARMEARVYGQQIDSAHLSTLVETELRKVPAIRNGIACRELHVDVLVMEKPFFVTGAKRKIEVRAEQ
jgi:phenylacetate-coenzyme A ligase PaaK-like adenylate-forming protein